MAIPVIYNIRSVRKRWTSSVVAILGVAGAVGIFIAMLSMARGFRATLVSSGSPQNAIIRRAGASSEMESSVTVDEVRIIETAPGVVNGTNGPLVSGEVVVVAAFPLASSGTDANVQVRGVSERALEVRPQVKMTQGRFFQSGLTELVVGRNAQTSYKGFELDKKVLFGGGEWTVVGIFDAGGSAFDSEIWCDARVLNQVYKRPELIYQSATVRLESPQLFESFKNTLTTDPRLTIRVDSERDYYEQQSKYVTMLIKYIGFFIAIVMGIGAVFAALNTMYSAVAERSREIATLRALGFSGLSVIISFVIESVIISFLGGMLGCALVFPLNGYTTGTINWQTFSHLAFAFSISPGLLFEGLVFAILMGVVGGVPPAVRAVRRPIAFALREL